MKAIFDDLKKHPMQHFILLAATILICVYAVYVFSRMAQMPHTGIYCFPEKKFNLKVVAIDPGSPGDISGLKKGDQILKVGDREILNVFNSIEIFHNIKPNHTYHVTYKRGTFIQEGSLTPGPPKFPYRTLFGIILGILYPVIGLIFYLKSPADPSSKIFYLLMVSLFTVTVIDFDLRALLNPAFFTFSFFAFIPLFLLHFSLIFPARKEIVNKHPWLLWLIYIPIIALLSVGALLVYRMIHIYLQGQNDPYSFQFMVLYFSALGFFYFIYMGLHAICLAHTFFTALSSETRKQLQWIMYGYVIAVILIGLGFYELWHDHQYLLLLAGARTLPTSMILAKIISFLAIFLAVLKYRLMDIDIVIHRSSIYFLVSGMTLLLYFLLFGLFSKIFGFLVGESTFITIAVSALLVAFMFRPLLLGIEQWVNRFFFQEKYALHKALEEISQTLITVRNPKIIFQNVYQTVGGALKSQSGMLCLWDQAGKTVDQIISFPDKEAPSLNSINPSHSLASYIIKTCKGVTQYQILTNKEFNKERNTYLEPFQETDMEIFLPLIYQHRLLGIIGFGEKNSGAIYSSEEVGLLTSLAHQIAVAMENAQAYHQIQMLNKDLEKKVNQVEQQQGEIMALQKQLLNENTYLRDMIKQDFNFDEIIGSGSSMKDVLSMVEKVAPTLSTVLIRGESGTGKELIARAIHFNSPRRKAPFIKINCASIPSNLLESELFGHEKGAFTGAIKLKTGKFELAQKGSIFLDEIGDLDQGLQAKILRVLQEKEFERVGGTQTIKANVRIITATNLDIEKAISKGTFREDLYYRLNVISISLPPLRDRKEDIRELTIHFLRKFGNQMGKTIQNIDPEAMEALKSYHWPGNVRELANAVERAVVLGESSTLSCNDLPQNFIPSHPPELLKKNGTFSQIIEQIEKQLIDEALDRAKGNKSEAAKILGLNRSTFNNKLRKLNIL